MSTAPKMRRVTLSVLFAVVMSMVVVSRKGITGVQSGDGIMQIDKTT